MTMLPLLQNGASYVCLILSSFLVAESLTAQTTIYRNQYGQRVDSTETYDTFYNLSPMDSGMTYVKEYSILAGGLTREGAWRNYNPDSVAKAIPVGLHRHYHLLGNLWYTEPYQDGKLQGELRSFYPDGKLKRIEQYQQNNRLSGKCFQPDGTEMPFTPLQQRPEYPGGENALMNYLASNIRYPKKARKAGIEGHVVVSFVVEKSGRISSINLLRTLGSGCDQEAYRVVSGMPSWLPGMMDGLPVKVRFTLPIRFRLE